MFSCIGKVQDVGYANIGTTCKQTTYTFKYDLCKWGIPKLVHGYPLETMIPVYWMRWMIKEKWCLKVKMGLNYKRTSQAGLEIRYLDKELKGKLHWIL